MPNFQAVPSALTFPATTVQGPVAGLYATAPTKTFIFHNNSGASVTITNYGFTNTTEGDGITQPAGILPDSDFTVIPTAGAYPVTVANGATQSFTVTYAPLRRGSGFGDVRSAIVMFFAGNKALSNGGQVLNGSGEVINSSVPSLFFVGVGGGVIEEAYDWAATSPLYRGAGDPSAYAAPSGYGNNAPLSNSGGIGANLSLADLDTVAHYSPMLFFAAPVTGSQSVTSYIPPTPAAFTTSTSTVPYALRTPAVNGSPRGGRGYQLLMFWADDTVTMNINVYAVTSSGNVLIATFTGIGYANSKNLFVGNNSGLDLQGLSLVVSTTVTAGSSAYNIGAVITG